LSLSSSAAANPSHAQERPQITMQELQQIRKEAKAMAMLPEFEARIKV
jgi:hypothetical protein